nr:immunoglobulin light chain junction region [Macaca mulatta]MOV79155.1 immunoglobulin light chain junction region [Macaca mulatta]
CQQHNSYPLAF